MLHEVVLIDPLGNQCAPLMMESHEKSAQVNAEMLAQKHTEAMSNGNRFIGSYVVYSVKPYVRRNSHE